MPNQRIFPKPTINKKEQKILFGRYKSVETLQFLEKIKRSKRTI